MSDTRASRLAEIEAFAQEARAVSVSDGLWLLSDVRASDIRLKEMVGLLREASNRLDRSLLSGSHHLGYYCTQCGGKEDESGCITICPDASSPDCVMPQTKLAIRNQHYDAMPNLRLLRCAQPV